MYKVLDSVVYKEEKTVPPLGLAFGLFGTWQASCAGQLIEARGLQSEVLCLSGGMHSVGGTVPTFSLN